MTTEVKLGPVIGRRRSIRRYEPGPIDEPVIERILLAATRAPSAHNRQPWRFAVLEDHPSKDRLATAMGRRLQQDRMADGDDLKSIEDDVARSYARLTEAPLVFVVCVDGRDMDQYSDKRRNEAEYLMAVQSTAMAAQNLLLAAQTEGLGACIMCAPLFCPDVVSDTLALPSQWQPQMLITVGRSANSGRDRPRLALEEVVAWRRRTPKADSAG